MALNRKSSRSLEHPDICLHPLEHTHECADAQRTRRFDNMINHKITSHVIESHRRGSTVWRSHQAVNLWSVVTAVVFCEFFAAQKTPWQFFMSLWLQDTAYANPSSSLWRKKEQQIISGIRWPVIQLTQIKSTIEILALIWFLRT